MSATTSAPPGEGPGELAAAAEALVAIGAELGRGALTVAESGNLSVRLRRHLLITRRGARLDRLRTTDLVAVPLDGSPPVGGPAADGSVAGPPAADGSVAGDPAAGPARGGPAPSSETPLHLGVYRNTDAAAVVHTHSRMATVLSALVTEIPPVHYAIHRLGDTVRVAPYATFGSTELADNVVAALAGRTAALMANHGALVYGRDPADALSRAQTLEWLAEVYYHALAVGSPRLLGPAELDAVRARAGSAR